MMCSLYAYNIPPFTTDIIVVQRLLFVLCHNDEEEEVGILSYTRDILGYTDVYCVIWGNCV